MSNYASGFSLEPRLCVKTETVITYPSLYTHTSMAGEIVICQKSKPYLPNFSRELVEFRPVYTRVGGGSRGFEGVRKKNLLVEQWLLQNTQAHKKAHPY